MTSIVTVTSDPAITVQQDVAAISAVVPVSLGASLKTGISISTPLTSGVDFNTITSAGFYYTIDAGSVNAPVSAQLWYLNVVVYGASPTTYCIQTATEVNGLISYTRLLVNGTWGAWQQRVFLNSSGQLPAVDGSQLTNLNIQLPFDFRNILYGNGGLEIWQRGAGGTASFSVAASSDKYTADRWFVVTNANQASTVSQIAGLTTQSQFAASIQRNSGQNGTGTLYFGYPLTTSEVFRLRGQTVSLQAYLQAGANFSAVSGTLSALVAFGTGAQGQRGLTPFTGETQSIATSINLTPGGAAQQLTATSASTVPTNVTQGEVGFFYAPVGTAGAADSFSIDDVQLEAATVPSAFERLPGAPMMADCRRHFRKSFPYTTAPAQSAGLSGAVYNVASGGNLGVYVAFEQPMISAPTIITYSPTAASANWSTNTTTPTPTTSATDSSINVDGSGATDANGYYIHYTADAGL